MERTTNRNILLEEQLVKLISERTGIDENMLVTILRYYHRIILHRIKLGDYVVMEDLFRIYYIEAEAKIEFTAKALRDMKKK